MANTHCSMFTGTNIEGTECMDRRTETGGERKKERAVGNGKNLSYGDLIFSSIFLFLIFFSLCLYRTSESTYT